MAGIWVEQSSIILKNSIVEKNQYNGLYLVDSSSLIDNVQFLDNTVCWGTAGPGQQSYGGSGLVVSGGSPGIKNSTFKKHRYAINIRDGGVPILENLIFGTGGEANECNIFQESQCIDSVPTP
jgi:parallel beta-helix repeat protein